MKSTVGIAERLDRGPSDPVQIVKRLRYLLALAGYFEFAHDEVTDAVASDLHAGFGHLGKLGCGHIEFGGAGQLKLQLIDNAVEHFFAILVANEIIKRAFEGDGVGVIGESAIGPVFELIDMRIQEHIFSYRLLGSSKAFRPAAARRDQVDAVHVEQAAAGIDTGRDEKYRPNVA